jgi:hypothetical protein
LTTPSWACPCTTVIVAGVTTLWGSLAPHPAEEAKTPTKAIIMALFLTRGTCFPQCIHSA